MDVESLISSKKKSCISLRILCFILGIIEVLCFTLSLVFRSKLFNFLRHHGQISKDSSTKYAFESAEIFAALRIGFEILQIISGICLMFGSLKEKYHLVVVNLHAITIYAILSPILWWEILYFENVNLIWIVPVWMGILFCCWYLPYKFKQKLWEKVNQTKGYDAEKLEADLGVDALN